MNHNAPLSFPHWPDGAAGDEFRWEDHLSHVSAVLAYDGGPLDDMADDRLAAPVDVCDWRLAPLVTGVGVFGD